MAISLNTGLVPYIGTGNPYVVIKGKFALGCLKDGGKAQVAPRLMVKGLTAAYGSGTFSMTVSGRGELGYVSIANHQLGDYAVDGLTNLDDMASGDASVYDGNGDAPGSVRMMHLSDQTSFSSIESAESQYQWKSYLGQPISEYVTIVLKGRLSKLDFTYVQMHTVASGTSYLSTIDDPIYKDRYFDFPDYGPGVGWRLYSLHIYDQPFRTVTLPAYFVNAGKRAYWN